MSTDPPPRSTEVPDHPQRRGAAAGTLIAWLVILGCVAGIVARPYWVPYVKPAPATRPEAGRPATGWGKSLQLEAVGRYAVGVRVFLPAGQEQAVDQLVAAVEKAIDGPVDALRAIPVLGELKGDSVALARLERFEQAYPADKRFEDDVAALRTIYVRGVKELPEDAARELVARHGWFGRLAVSHGLDATDPRRVAALAPAGRAVIVGMAATAGGAIAVVSGIVLGILALVMYFKGRLPRAYRPPEPGTAGPFVEAFAVYLVSFLGLSVALGLLFPHAGTWVNWAVTVVLPLVFAWLRVRGVSWAAARRGLGWHAGRGVWREAGAGLAGYVAGLPVIGVGIVITVLLTKATGARPTHPIQDMPTETAGDVLGILLLAAVWAPVIEETMFRGALFHHLRGRFGWWASTGVVSLIFAAIHPQGWAAAPALASIAVVLAGVREWRGSIIGPMVAHGLHNGVLVVVFVTMAG